MKKLLITLALLAVVVESHAQTVVIPNNLDTRAITTGVPFILIASDARAASLGDMGVATSVDGFSQQWNSSKYAFSTYKQGFAVSYTPYLSKLVKDIFLGNLTYYNRLNEQSAFAASLRYFSVGDIEFVQDEFSEALIQRPNEFTIDLSYSLKLSEQFSTSVAMRYLRSDLKIQGVDADASAANTFGVDISGYYQSEEEAYNDFNGRYRLGFAIQNIGPKFKYDEGGVENFQPTTLRLGGGFDFIFDEYNKLSLTGEVTKLLVPTPPIYGSEYEYTESGDTPGYQEDEDELVGYPNNPVATGVIVDGKDPDVGFLKGMFQSFGDAPGGFSEELREFTWALSAEYYYQNSFAIRAGYFNEAEDKGARKFFALGAGFRYNVVNVDLSYLFSASKVQSPLEGTLRFSLTFNLGADSFFEY
ncbi:MAG: type IX secretion system outer membrane channel protein PorV [Flavobacteriaceae bacterium]|nr:type IX secretion system outer membrane channel protein PorV [Mangrovimonas sp.]MCB0469888.1 type IX secretion system outer membrane channel protein PorV [Flavobacteriaceae bacterium]MCB0428014.1 type IX secretion system outer membrane channel protein PorV [Mangrovimonas sp.]MCB0432511.1 type IX secretion system outer membrane channel protein PorV [Mangrovimonas sp.]MCB0435618.1 type IX secretion system outer membrane channel protein PorV [Mangrovimonas sp.]